MIDKIDALSRLMEDVPTGAASALSGAVASWDWHIPGGRITGDAPFAALYSVTGEKAAEGIVPGAFFAIIHPLDQTRIRLAIGGMLRGAQVLSKEYRILLRDGAIRWIHARGRCHYDEQDQPVRVSGVLVDITDQKRAEERLRIAQTAGGIGTFEYVDGFGTASVSAQFCSLLGFHPADDLPVRTINAVVHPDDPPIIDTSRQPAPGETSRVDFRIIRPDNGEQRWLTRRGEHIHDAETSIRFIGVIYDVTDAKRIEGELRTLNETLEARVEERTRERDRIWRVSRDLYVLCGPDGLCRSANPAWESELGYQPSELAGRRLGEFAYPDDRVMLDAVIGQMAKGEYVESFDIRMVARDGGPRWFSWTCVPEGDAFFAAGRDVTHRNQLEEQLRQSQKMEAVGQLTGGIAHDFNNLLTGIIGSLDMLRRRIGQGRLDSADRFMDAAVSSAERAAALTHRLLAFSRRQSLDARLVDVNRLVESMEDLIHRTLGEQILIVTNLAPDLWRGFTDANQLENALLNLSINARDAMPDGGTLSIATRNVTLTLDYTRHHPDLAPGDYVAISVSDTGIGMTPEIVAKAFDPFFTTKPIGQGTGLGLSMIYGFAKQSGGHVRIDSAVGNGTVVTLYVRRFTGVGVEEDQTGAKTKLPVGEGETVLLVEDDPAVRMLVLEVLQELGYETVEAADSQAALPVLESGRRIDLMVSDVGLPGMNGRQLAEIARQYRPALKVLFITGYAESAAVRSEFLVNGMDMISKPFKMQVLATKIRSMLS